MAKNTSTVYLGFEDESVSDKNKHLIDFTTNKVGGQPIWPNSDITVHPCPICGLKRPLVLQIYAPLENSQFHRTLYVFSCVNATCSTQSKGWLCVRVQQIENVAVPVDKDGQHRGRSGGGGGAAVAAANINWCSGADDWDVPDDADNCNEQNGNVINKIDNRMSDEDEESNSMESDPIPGFGNIQVDDKNANCGAQGGAVGRIHSPNAYAEIEGEESELVTIDTPLAPQRDLIALLKQTTAVPADHNKISLKSFFINVEEEQQAGTTSVIAEHVRELLHEYQGKDDKVRTSPSSPGNIGVAAGGNVAIGGNDGEEQYEKGIPIHGDVMFHNFLVILQENPGQILRYSRDAMPLLVAPLPDFKPKCPNCGDEMLCEVQVLPTLIPKLRFANGDPAPIEFGNVLVYTCQQSCWDTPDKMRMEHVLVQKEN